MSMNYLGSEIYENIKNIMEFLKGDHGNILKLREC